MLMAEKTISIERVYTIPLRSEWVKEPRSKRSNRAIRTVREFVKRHTKAKDIKLSKGVNELIFSRGFQKPPGKIKVEVSGDRESMQVKLPGEIMLEKKEKKKGLAAGLKDRLVGKEESRDKKEAARKELKEKTDKELTQEKLDAVIEKTLEEETAKQDRAMPAKVKKAEDALEKELEKVEEAAEKGKQ
jgi:large subunit ribosomal protein L31e